MAIQIGWIKFSLPRNIFVSKILIALSTKQLVVNPIFVRKPHRKSMSVADKCLTGLYSM